MYGFICHNITSFTIKVGYSVARDRDLITRQLNTGHNNYVHDMVLVNVPYPGSISCQNFATNNCLMPPGQGWGNYLKTNLDNPTYNSYWPWIKDLYVAPLDNITNSPAHLAALSSLTTAPNATYTVISPPPAATCPLAVQVSARAMCGTGGALLTPRARWRAYTSSG